MLSGKAAQPLWN